jgi:hypothetical protein
MEQSVMTDNLAIWNKVRNVPPEHLKNFTRGGGFKGTAIKPMWAIKTMTEIFGPVGDGWGMDKPDFQVVAGHNNEVMVYCTVRVWTASYPGEKEIHDFYGVGGDKVVGYIKANTAKGYPERWENDDEAFKKAYTDAIGNALKFLGVAADIHMGLWDGSKYSKEADDKPAASKADSRPEYDRISKGLKEIAQTGTIEDLKLFWKSNIPAIEKLPDDWIELLNEEAGETKDAIKAKAAT